MSESKDRKPHNGKDAKTQDYILKDDLIDEIHELYLSNDRDYGALNVLSQLLDFVKR